MTEPEVENLEPVASAGIFCHQHPEIEPDWECAKCHFFFCMRCVSPADPTLESKKIKGVCPECGGACALLAGSEPESTYFQLLEQAFFFPLRGGGVFILFFGSLLTFILPIMLLIPFFGWLGFIGGNLYLITIFKDILLASMNGDKEPPEWQAPDIVDMIRGFFGVLILSFVCYWPLYVIMVLNYLDIINSYAAFLTTALICTISVPMIMTAFVLDLKLMLNPLKIIRTILKIKWHYLCTIIVLIIIEIAMGTAYSVLRMWGGLLNYYLIVVAIRIIGITYYANADIIGWERAAPIPEKVPDI